MHAIIFLIVKVWVVCFTTDFERIRMHNDFARRIPVIEERLKVGNHRISDLEELHKPNN